MALSRGRSGRFASSAWPGFVDAMSALILVLFFVLSIFMIVQFVLRDTISGQGRELDALSLQLSDLAESLGVERRRADTEASRAAALAEQQALAEARMTAFEAEVANLMAQNFELTGRLDAAEAESAERLIAAEALEAALADARGDLETSAEALDAAEAARLAEVAVAEELRQRLENSDAELTAMTLRLEAERQRAEETLTLLAAAEAAREALEAEGDDALSEAERRAAQLAQARTLLAEQEEMSAEAQRQVALLNQQTAELRRQLSALQSLIDEAAIRDAEAQVQIETLGSSLNTALARVAAEERARAELEARERARLEAEAVDLARYRSEFFGRMQQILGAREGVQVVGDRFVFPSEVLFAPGSATLGAEGQAQVARVASVIREIMDDIPPEIDWILRVDGHTDRQPLGPASPFADNWELSQARALSVVRYMMDAEGLPADRLAATGFGEFQPIDTGFSAEALARNRRIELKFTER